MVSGLAASSRELAPLAGGRPLAWKQAASFDWAGPGGTRAACVNHGRQSRGSLVVVVVVVRRTDGQTKIWRQSVAPS